EGGVLRIDGTDEAHARRLFGLDTDHETALALFRDDRHLAPLLADYAGLRVMRQDPWQCLVSFVCSSMSNVKRIQANVEGIAAAFGEGGAFPAPRRLRKGSLKPIRLGWREKFIEALFASVDTAWLGAVANKNFEEARAALVELPG